MRRRQTRASTPRTGDVIGRSENRTENAFALVRCGTSSSRYRWTAPDGERWITDLDGPNDSSTPGGRAGRHRSICARERCRCRSWPPPIAATSRKRNGRFPPPASVACRTRHHPDRAMSVFIRLALRPFDELGRGLQTVHSGTSRQLRGRFPQPKSSPLSTTSTGLSQFQDAAVDRAKTQAGDLAHALKTPLAILGAVARQAANDGRKDLAEPIDEQITPDAAAGRSRAGSCAGRHCGGAGPQDGPASPRLPARSCAYSSVCPIPGHLQWEC